VIQGDKIILENRFYDVLPASGGVPTDPDGYLHTWDIQNDAGSRVSRIVLLEGGAFPTSAIKYYFSIIDNAVDSFEVKGYDDAGRTNEIVSTGLLSYGVYSNQAMAEVGGSGYDGLISVTFPGVGLPDEDFEIEDIGATEPTYEIIDQNNSTLVSTTLFPTRIGVGHYSVEYEVAVDAVPGENWRLVGRGTINGIDTYVSEYFRVIDASVVKDEVGKLITLTELKAGIEKHTDEDDALLDSYILAASHTCEEWCLRLFHEEAKTVRFDGNGASKIYFEDVGPISSIVKLECSSYPGTVWSEVSTDYITHSDYFIVRTDGAVFYEGFLNWRMEYIAGVAGAPAQVRRAVVELVRYWYNSKNRPGIKADVVGGGLRVVYDDSSPKMPNNVILMLKAYRRLS